MNNGKQWAKAFMAIIIGLVPICLASYANAVWYYVFLTICSLFGVLGIIALFQLFIYTVLFPRVRNFFVKAIFVLSILIAISLPLLWVWHNESNPQNLLKNNYEVTEATLTNSTSNKNGDSTIIEYVFEIKGKKYFSKKTVLKTPKNNPFYIKYLPQEPEINELTEN